MQTKAERNRQAWLHSQSGQDFMNSPGKPTEDIDPTRHSFTSQEHKPSPEQKQGFFRMENGMQLPKKEQVGIY